MSVQIRYIDIAPDAKPNFTLSASDIEPYAKIENLKLDNVQYQSFNNPCALYSVLLNSTLPPFPNNPNDYTFGLVSREVSGMNGSFASPPVLTLSSSGQYSSQGVTLVFDRVKNQWANDLQIDWYRGSTQLSSKRFSPDAPEYFCQNRVENYNKLVITFYKINMPQNRLTLNAYDHGVVRDFFDDTQEIEKVSIIQEVDPISQTLSINTTDFILTPQTDIDFMFQKKQRVNVYFNGVLKSVCFVETGARLSKNKWSTKGIDYVGLLDKTTFYGGVYVNKKAGDLIADIIAGKQLENIYVPYTLDSNLYNILISGYLPISTRREALAQVLFAIGAVCDTSNSETLNIFSLSDSIVATIPIEDTYQGQSFESKEKISEVQFIAHYYSKINETTEVYKAIDSGTGSGIRVEFSDPLWGLTIVNGIITEEADNYAIITANTGCVLTGKQYNHTTRLFTVVSPAWNTGDIRTVAKVENVTIWSDPQQMVERVYNYLSKTQVTRSTVKVEGFKIGDTIALKTYYLGDVIGICESMRFNLVGGFVKAEVLVR